MAKKKKESLFKEIDYVAGKKKREVSNFVPVRPDPHDEINPHSIPLHPEFKLKSNFELDPETTGKKKVRKKKVARKVADVVKEMNAVALEGEKKLKGKKRKGVNSGRNSRKSNR